MSEEPTLYFGSLDAEAAWRDERLATLPEVTDRQARRVVQTLDELQFPFCEPGDLLVTSEPVVPSHRDYLESIGFRFEHVFAGSPEVSARLASLRPSPYAVVPGLFAARGLPPVEVVQRVNSKSYSSALAERWSLFGAGTVVRSIEELVRESGGLLERGSIVLKDPFGVSGKGTLVLRSPAEVEGVAARLSRQVASGKRLELIVQPLYQRAVDFSCHLEVLDDGVRHHGLQAMDNDGFAFSRVGPPGDELRRRVEAAGYFHTVEKVGRALAAEGYLGPVCVDSMWLRDGTLVPLLEINARKSMGLINLRLGQRVGPKLFSHLGLVNLVLERPIDFDEVLGTLRRSGLLYEARGPGLLPLSGNAVIANLAANATAARGRLYFSAITADASTASALVERLPSALAELGVRIPGHRHG